MSLFGRLAEAYAHDSTSPFDRPASPGSAMPDARSSSLEESRTPRLGTNSLYAGYVHASTPNGGHASTPKGGNAATPNASNDGGIFGRTSDARPTLPFEYNTLSEGRLKALFAALGTEPEPYYTPNFTSVYLQVGTSFDERVGFTALEGLEPYLVRCAFADLRPLTTHALIVRVFTSRPGNGGGHRLAAVLQTVEAFDTFLAEILPTL